MPIETTTPKPAHDAMAASSDHVFLDVRTQQEFDAGHPTGALNVPIGFPDPAAGGMAPNPNFVAVVEKHVPKDKKVFVSCKMGGRSMAACQALQAAGYADLVNIDGGFGGKPGVAGWAEEGLPVDTSPSTYADLEG